MSRSLVRKLVYAVLILLLLLPLSYYSQPATVEVPERNEPASPGGKLAQLREKNHMSQADLGDIDPAGETIKLCTLGMRGVGACLLWHEANKAKMKEDWTSLETILDQLTKLQPNYSGPWRFQGWNVAYNVAVEFDDYKQRYFWIKEGIKYLLKGFKYNDDEHRLLEDVGTYTGRKIGVADEKVEYRQLFRDDVDPDFPNHDGRQRPLERRDNWLVAREYYEQAIDLVESKSLSLKTMNPVLFYSEPAKAQMNYADGLEVDGTFGKKAGDAWNEGLKLWEEFGLHDLVTVFGQKIRLSELDQKKGEYVQLRQDLDALDPGLRLRIIAEKKDKLSPDERQLLDMGLEGMMGLTTEQQGMARAAYQKLEVTHKEVADRVAGEGRPRAQEIVKQLESLDNLITVLSSNNDTVNFPYWRMRCRMEASPAALEGERLIYEARDYYHNQSNVPKAKAVYEQAFGEWRKVYGRIGLTQDEADKEYEERMAQWRQAGGKDAEPQREFPAMLGDAIGGEKIVDAVMDYHDVLSKLELLGPDDAFPDDLVLPDLIEILKKRGHFGAPNPPPAQRMPPPGGRPPGA
jgi:hypothetical protein